MKLLKQQKKKINNNKRNKSAKFSPNTGCSFFIMDSVLLA